MKRIGTILAILGLWILMYVIASTVVVAAERPLHRPMVLEECGGLANDIRSIAVMRDAGEVDEATMLANIKEGATKHVGEPDSYLQTEEDVTFLLDLVHAIYASKMEPQDLAVSFYNFCSAHAVKKGLTT